MSLHDPNMGDYMIVREVAKTINSGGGGSNRPPDYWEGCTAIEKIFLSGVTACGLMVMFGWMLPYELYPVGWKYSLIWLGFGVVLLLGQIFVVDVLEATTPPQMRYRRAREEYWHQHRWQKVAEVKDGKLYLYDYKKPPLSWWEKPRKPKKKKPEKIEHADISNLDTGFLGRDYED